MNARVGRIIKETAKIQKKEGFAHYVDCHAAAQDESFIDGVKTIGAGAPKIAFRAVGDGVGADVKPRSAGLFLSRCPILPVRMHDLFSSARASLH